MSFYPPVPEFSKKQINVYGSQLVESLGKDQECLDAINLWRASHAYPLNTFSCTLRNKIRILEMKGAFAAQRLKRLPTILQKLSRFEKMQLSRMQDIAGLRAVLKNKAQLNKIYSYYQEENKLTHKLIKIHDYIKSPKPDGYRSIHLIFQYKSKIKNKEKAAEYNGLNIELQLRTQLQHLWATAVETSGILLDHGFKFGRGDEKWRDFFALISSAFAHIEGSPPVEAYNKLSKEETYQEIAQSEKKYKFLEKLQGVSFAIQLPGTLKKKHYQLITLNITHKTVEIKSYSEEQSAEAIEEYARLEKYASEGTGDKIEPVLVSVGSLEAIQKAYPNYFLDIRLFIEKVQKIIKEAQAIKKK